jgi:Predicted metal-dependent hydrolase with the TIM-barrel fold
MRSICLDRIGELQDLGYQTLLDPCPADLGRDVELMVEVAEATGFNIICATGLYREEGGGAFYWTHKAQYEDIEGVMEEMFVSELTEGIGTTGVRPGIIKCGTGHGSMTRIRRKKRKTTVARASVVTGAPVTTHTDDGTVGDLQQQVLTRGNVPSNRIIIGHSCGTTDTDYHMTIASGGSYLGF